MIFEIEEFDDLSKQSLDKLTKLRDIAEDYRLECNTELNRAAERVNQIQLEIIRRRYGV